MSLTRVSSALLGGQGLDVGNTATQNTAAIQALIDNQTDGGLIVIPKGCSFNLKQLDGSVNEYDLQYWAEDEADNIGDGSNPGTNEKMFWSSNWKQQSGGTVDVNEWRFEAPYHPGIVLNNRENIEHYGSGTDFNGQASIVLKKNNYNQFQLQELNNADRNMFAISSWEVRQVFPIGSSSFSSAPVAQELIVGNTSGAKGIVLVVTSSTMTVSWLYGEFVVGETVTVDGTKTSTVGLPSAPTFSYNNKPFRLIAPLDSSGIGVNTPPARVKTALNVGGGVTLETGQGGGFGSAVARLALYDDAITPTTGGNIGIDANGDLRLQDSADATIGSFDAGGSFSVTLKDAPTGNSVTPTQSSTYRESAGMIWFSIFLLNINTSGLTAGNQIHVVGLPKTSRSSGNATSNVNVLCSNVTSTAGNVMAQIVPNTSYIKLFDSTTSGSANLNVSAITSGTGDLTISGCYSI